MTELKSCAEGLTDMKIVTRSVGPSELGLAGWWSYKDYVGKIISIIYPEMCYVLSSSQEQERE